MSFFAIDNGRVLVNAEGLAQALRNNRPNREDADQAGAIIDILIAQRAELARLLQAFLAIDDWTDGSIAPPELITETKAALAALEGLTFEEAA